MDALIYTVMSGAERSLREQQVRANNLANADTPGFRADKSFATAMRTPGYGYDARHMSELSANGVSERAGPIRQTGRELDVAITGEGYLAVRHEGGEAYTRAGSIAIDAEGMLSVNGRPLLGDGGPIVLPPSASVQIGADGTVSVLPPGQAEMQPVDRLKLVKPEPGALVKNEAGLLVPRDPQAGALPLDETVQVKAGYLEGSNVSAVEEMVATMATSRDFEIQMKLYGAAERMAQAGDRLVRG
jgi:flagellar basal-body rod protein FlgF